MNPLADDIKSLNKYFALYIKRKLWRIGTHFEGVKNLSVDLLMARRGMLQKRVWHGSMIGLSTFGMITSGIFGGQTMVSASFPGVGGQDPRFVNSFSPIPDDPVLNSFYDTRTNISKKPRSEILEYEVESGDTLSSISAKFDISTDTILWANDLSERDTIAPGDKLKILPDSGVSHKVASGDTLELIAKKYDVSSQAILDYPFNDVTDDLKLKAGQVLIVPGGTPPSQPSSKKSKPSSPQYLAKGPSFSAPGGGSFAWPTNGTITQYFAWYHPGDDIANNSAPPITASDGGTVTVAGWPDNYGYGNRVVIDHGNGYQTLYAHLSNIYVTPGQTVSRGQVLGQMGSTGRSTGTHLHFEIRYKGIAVNPLAILK